jgi:hypothetical protein
MQQIDLDAYLACGVVAQGGIACWGATTRPEGRPPANLPPARQVSVGFGHICALLRDGAVRCWGSNSDGQLNVPADLPAAVQVVADGHFTCALGVDGSVRCWGDPAMAPPVDLPPAVHLASGAVEGSPRSEQACALAADGSLRCWGHGPFTGGIVNVPEGLQVALGPP